MARKLYVTDDMGLDDGLADIAQVNFKAAMMWPWLIPYLDDWGRGDASARRIKGKIFPNFEQITADDVELALQDFARAGLIILYAVGGKRYLAIEGDKWFSFQTHIKGNKREIDESRFPAPPPVFVEDDSPERDDARICAQTRDDARICAQNPASLSLSLRLSPSPSPSPSPSHTSAAAQPLPVRDEGELPQKTESPPKNLRRAQASHHDPPGFIAFCAAYPRKKDRAKAESAWDKLKPDGALQEKILKHIARAILSDEWREDGGRYIPYPGTYLNGARWEDGDDAPIPGATDRNGGNYAAVNGRSASAGGGIGACAVFKPGDPFTVTEPDGRVRQQTGTEFMAQLKREKAAAAVEDARAAES